MNLLAQAIKTDDLDAALKPVMDALGITDGGIAGQMLDPAEWLAAKPAERSGALSAWLRAECLNTVMEAA